MNLPFSPTFFRKMDIYQQLMEYEGQKSKKHLWKGEKAVLIWSASEHHQHLGSFINTGHLEDALKYCVQEKFITKAEHERMKGSARHILDSLPVHEFGELEEGINLKTSSVKINRNGILAGRILTETNFLNNNWAYNAWTLAWWFVLGAGAIILFIQAATSIKSLWRF